MPDSAEAQVERCQVLSERFKRKHSSPISIVTGLDYIDTRTASAYTEQLMMGLMKKPCSISNTRMYQPPKRTRLAIPLAAATLPVRDDLLW